MARKLRTVALDPARYLTRLRSVEAFKIRVGDYPAIVDVGWQLTLPARIRRDLGISEDTYLLAEEVGDFVVLRRAETRFLELSESFQKEAKRKGITREALLRALKGARRRRSR